MCIAINDNITINCKLVIQLTSFPSMEPPDWPTMLPVAVYSSNGRESKQHNNQLQSNHTNSRFFPPPNWSTRLLASMELPEPISCKMPLQCRSEERLICGETAEICLIFVTFCWQRLWIIAKFLAGQPNSQNLLHTDLHKAQMEVCAKLFNRGTNIGYKIFHEPWVSWMF